MYNAVTKHAKCCVLQELLKKCNQCMDIIVSAKDRQAAEANKNASILLEQIDQERSREESKRAAAARKREKRRKKKKEKQEKEQRQKDGVVSQKWVVVCIVVAIVIVIKQNLLLFLVFANLCKCYPCIPILRHWGLLPTPFTFYVMISVVLCFTQ